MIDEHALGEERESNFDALPVQRALRRGMFRFVPRCARNKSLQCY
jgi:hypothetical protein